MLIADRYAGVWRKRRPILAFSHSLLIIITGQIIEACYSTDLVTDLIHTLSKAQPRSMMHTRA
ncbi:MAG: hypothetical protein [Olavius algarvensis Delta 4 endosymbiont]|nr:MAG: hypothetical protein [Olavius algarvensis Delta 4 endosymbiont]